MEKNINRLYVMEEFYSLQGEGFHSGEAAYFVRLAGCHVRCDFCDVKEAWEQSNFPAVEIESILERAKKTLAPTLIVTGGEPMLQELSAFCTAAKKSGFKLFLETSGSVEINGEWDWICVSPKKNKAVLESSLQKASELKVVIESDADFQWAEEHAKKTTDNCQLFLQSEWEKRESIYPIVTRYIQTHPQWRLSVQLHKYLGIE